MLIPSPYTTFLFVQRGEKPSPRTGTQGGAVQGENASTLVCAQVRQRLVQNYVGQLTV